MEDREGSSSHHLRPSITLPPRSSMENMFAGGAGPGAASPGPMTLVSNFFSENDPDSDCGSFSQLLAGAMTSPTGRSGNHPVVGKVSGKDYVKQKFNESNNGCGRGDVDNFQFKQGRPATGLVGRPPGGLVVSQQSMFTIPPGMSPTSLLDSPGFFPPNQGSVGISHQQVLAHVTAQAAQPHPPMHIQNEYPSLSSAPTTSLPQIRSFTSTTMKHEQMPPPMLNSNTMNESSDISNSDQRYQPSSVAVDKPADDGYNWRKYGQKQVKGSEFPRSYYKCTHPNCPVKKKVERSLEGLVTEIIYKGQHNHQPPQSKRAKDTGNTNGSSNLGQSGWGTEYQVGNMNKSREIMQAYSLSTKDQESSQATHMSGSSDSEEVGDAETRVNIKNEDEPEAKRRNIEVPASDPNSSHRTVTEPRIIVQTTCEVDLLDDGYRWRKYGQKVVKGNPHPRSYYKCTSVGCNVRKHVERAASDPKAVITTYEGKHIHDVPAAKNSSHNIANNTSQLKPHNPVADRQALVSRPDYGNNNQQQPIGLRFKEEHIT